MKILLDTNIYLNFFRRQGDQSLELLNSLISFVEQGKFEILLPKQIKDEYLRRKDDVISEHISELKKGTIAINAQIPLFLNSFKKSSKLKSVAKRFNKLQEEVIQEYKKRSANPNSEINKKINRLFTLAIQIPESQDILQKAYFRTLKGNPPKKGEKSFGDAIIWESILQDYVNDDLCIISGDGDFAEKKDNEKLNHFLLCEWSEKSKNKIKLYLNLGFFVNEQSGKKKPIKKETIEEENYLNKMYNNVYHQDNAGYIPNLMLGNNSVLLSDVLQNNTYRPVCGCCGEEYGNSGILDITGRCEKCRDFLTVPKKCEICLKHYHVSIMTTDNVLARSICGDCKTK